MPLLHGNSVVWGQSKNSAYFKHVFEYILVSFYTDPKLQTTNYKLQTTNYKLQTTNYKLQTTNYKLQTTQYHIVADKLQHWLSAV